MNQTIEIFFEIRTKCEQIMQLVNLKESLLKQKKMARMKFKY